MKKKKKQFLQVLGHHRQFPRSNEHAFAFKVAQKIELNSTFSEKVWASAYM